jgi:hypothetical protein
LSKQDLTTPECEFTKEIEASALEAHKKAAAAGWSTPNGLVYAEVSLSLRRVLHRHVLKCGVCIAQDGATSAPVSSAPVSPSAARTSDLKHILQSGGLYPLATIVEDLHRGRAH